MSFLSKLLLIQNLSSKGDTQEMINILEVLTDEKSRINFMRGLINLAKAEEAREGSVGINTEEMIFLKNSMLALNLTEHSQRELEAFVRSKDNTIKISFETKKQALFFLREGMQICYIEGQYYQAEKDMIEEMANMLGIGSETVEKIEKWVKEGIEWSARGEEILEMEG